MLSPKLVSKLGGKTPKALAISTVEEQVIPALESGRVKEPVQAYIVSLLFDVLEYKFNNGIIPSIGDKLPGEPRELNILATFIDALIKNENNLFIAYAVMEIYDYYEHKEIKNAELKTNLKKLKKYVRQFQLISKAARFVNRDDLSDV